VGWLNIPNLLSLSRLGLTPFAVAAVLRAEYRTALAILAAAAVTDGLDGLLARRLGCMTRLGAYLDPIADKALLSGTYLALGASGLAPWWLVGLIFGRDLLILALAGAALLFTRYREFPPSVWGKLSTGVQVLVALLVIVGRTFPAVELPPGPLLGAVAAATAWSGINYLWRAFRLAQLASRG
jgi:cardiolipin synthase